MKITVSRYHDISCGHRVYGHEGKCSHLHGHNYRVHFDCEADQLDDIGRIIDFSVIKLKLCMWIEDKYDHRFLVWSQDPISSDLLRLDPTVAIVPYNPTAENIAKYLAETVSPYALAGTGVRVVRVKVEETAKCNAIYYL
jgi:6-pyruvoyltetrahydropterin/6-carboxytetrahydropterin synthase